MIDMKNDFVLKPISEYDALEDFKCVWSQEVKSSLSANGIGGGNKISVEKLFTVGKIKMIKFITTIAIILFLIGCTPETEEIGNKYDIPKELSDCVFLYMRDTSTNGIKVVRCPNSTTSVNYTSGKSTQSVIVVDGVEYVAKDLNR